MLTGKCCPGALPIRPDEVILLKRTSARGEQPVALLISINLPVYVRTPDPKSIVAQIALLNAKSTFVLIIG